MLKYPLFNAFNGRVGVIEFDINGIMTNMGENKYG